MINFFKNFIIAFLMILAVYQTAELWFGNYSDHNFFSFSSENIKDIDIGKASMNSIIINIGNNRAITKLTDINENEYKESLDFIIENTIKKGSFLKDDTLDWNKIIEKKCFIYKYNIRLNSSALESIFDIKNTNTLKINNFDTIVITPDTGENIVYVSFVDSKYNSQTMFMLKKGNYAKEAADILSIYSSTESNIYYISSTYNGFEVFNNNIFIPQWMQARLSYKPMEVTRQFEDINNVEKYADLFFDNPAGKWSSVVNDVYTYSDENNVVKFNTNGVLEYSGYKVSNSGNYNFYENYLTAVQFINRDNVTNSIFLSDYYEEDNKSVFLFDYTINDAPVFLSSELKKKTGLNSIIEVTVTNGVVTKYARYGCSLSESSELSYGSVDFVSAVDDVFNDIQQENLTEDLNKKVDKLEFGYIIDSDVSRLYWIMSIDGNEYMRCVE